MRRIQKLPVVMTVLLLIAIAFTTVLGEDQGCGTKGDWKDIYILQSNPSPGTNIKVSLSTDKMRVNPGDELVITYRADKDCYVTLMNIGTSGRIVRLWPNEYSGQDNFIRADSPRQFPGPGDTFKYRISGPSGTERIIAYATMEKGKILTESEFQALANTGFKEFKGGAKDLAVTFQRNTNALTSDSSWGTAQLNICVGSQVQQPVAPAETGKLCVLSLGVPTGDLKFCKKDAQRFVDAMTTKMGVKESNVKLILGSEATYDGFVNGLKWLGSVTQPEDTAVIYFSGHGSRIPDQPPLDEQDGMDECFVLYHTKPVSDYQTALRERILMVDDDFNKLIKPIPARKKIVVVDSCHSGTISRDVGSGSAKLVSKYYPLMDAATGKELPHLRSKSTPTNYGNDSEALLSACLDDQVAYEDQGKQAGLFTYSLLEAIQAGAGNLEQAFEKAKQITEQQTKQFASQYGGSTTVQTPNLTDPLGYVKLLHFGK